MPEVQLCFSWGAVDLRQGTANTKLPFWARIKEKKKRTTFPWKGSVMHWSGPLTTVTCTNIMLSGFYALCKQEQQAGCNKKDSTDSIAYKIVSISSSSENIFNIIPWIIRICHYQYQKSAFLKALDFIASNTVWKTLQELNHGFFKGEVHRSVGKWPWKNVFCCQTYVQPLSMCCRKSEPVCMPSIAMKGLHTLPGQSFTPEPYLDLRSEYLQESWFCHLAAFSCG